jgi:hypothetical protein
MASPVSRFSSMRIISQLFIGAVVIGRITSSSDAQTIWPTDASTTSTVDAQNTSSVHAHTTNVLTGNGYYLDRFNYDVTSPRTDGFKDFGPQDWGDIQCDEENSLRSCLVYTDKWETGREWAINKNYCRWCPIDDPESCNNRHHQSPINLRRAVGLEPGTHHLTNECIVGRTDL